MTTSSPPDPPTRPGEPTDWKGPDELLPSWGPTPEAVPVAIPVSEEDGTAPEAVPVALPVPAEETPLPVIPPLGSGAAEAVEEVAPEAPLAPEPPPAPALLICPVCGSANPKRVPSCDDCGYYFSAAELA